MENKNSTLMRNKWGNHNTSKRQGFLACQKPGRTNLNKRGQLKTQELAFVVLAITLLAVLAFLFYLRMQLSQLQETSQQLNEQRAISLRDKIVNLPEFKCSVTDCMDKDKVLSSEGKDLSNLFHGLNNVKIIEIYPGDEKLTLYDSGKPSNASYSTFIDSCSQENLGDRFKYNCSVALLEVGI